MNVDGPPPEPTLQLEGLRGFVTVLRLRDDADGRLLAAYVSRFAAGDDATLILFDPRADPDQTARDVAPVLARTGVPDAAQPDILVVAVAPEPGNLYPIARAARAVLGDGDGDGWLPIDRPAYGAADLDRLRDHADAYWGRRRPAAAYSYEASIDHLVARGWCTEHHVRDGAIPEPSLQRVYEAFKAQLPQDARLLHVGNFLGVSLAYLLAWSRNEGRGPVVSVDPNIPHRGVQRPQDAVVDLLAHFGLDDRHVLTCGYSLEQTLSNDGVVFGDYDPGERFSDESAPQHVLKALTDLGLQFDGVLIDGNHDGRYLRRELAYITRLLRPGGLLVLDDVNEWWAGVLEVFEEATAGGAPFEQVEFDRRIGILRRLP
jgi:SAM-dependent methyltransferase